MAQKRNKEEEIAEILAKIILSQEVENDTSTKEWYAENQHADRLVKRIGDAEFKDRLKNFDREEKFQQALQLRQRIERKKRNRLFVTVSSTAALMLLSVLIYFQTKPIAENKVATIIDKPTLILENGTTFSLDTLSKLNNSKLNIRANKNSMTYGQNNYDDKLNTIVIPSKYIYTVILSDSSRITLNANSKLIYPTSFNEKKREVILEGEAYFEVTKSNIPFVVKSNGTSVKVYGTTFNVNAYDPENMQAVLLTGLIGVTHQNREQLLLPNQHISINERSGKSEIKTVNAADHILWMNGQIKSYHSELDDLITKLSRWYGVTVRFNDELKRKIPITASFDNRQPFENIIPVIEFSTNVKIKKEKGDYIIY